MESLNNHDGIQKVMEDSVNQCIEENVLAPFLESNKKEIIDIMSNIFVQLEINRRQTRDLRREAYREGCLKGCQDRDQLYSVLLKQLIPLGRIDELIDASSDSSKRSALAKEFEIKI